jgi:hypothetical protein
MISLKDWIPALAQTLHGAAWSPNLDFVTHLEAQQEAKKLGIAWSRDMDGADVMSIIVAMLARHGYGK